MIYHLDRFGSVYASQWAMVMAVTTALQGEAAMWVANLYSDRTRELGDVGLFLEALRVRLEDVTRVQRAEAEIVGLQQNGRPATEYVREFREVAGKLGSWPERMLIHHLQNSLDGALQRACIVRRIPPRLQEWLRVSVELDVGLRGCKGRAGIPVEPRQALDRSQQEEQQPVTPKTTPTAPPPRATLRCFQCDQPGHRVVDCPIPAPRTVAGTTPA